MQRLALDPELRGWVFLPLTLCIVLMKLIQQYMHMLTFNAPPANNKEAKEIREVQLVARSQRLRQFWRFIPESSFNMRKGYFVEKDTGVFHMKTQSRPMHEAMATDPNMMVDMMKKNMSGMIPQLAMGMVVNFFFGGFVMGKIPFALSPRFKPMLQRGIDLTSLDVSYFTSLSYYILLLFGARGVFSLVFREDTIDDTEMMRRQMNPMGNQMAFDVENAFKGERAALAALDHEWELDNAEEKAIEILRAMLKQKA